MLRLSYRENMFFDWLLEVVYFPFWWYTVGLYRAVRYAWFFLVRREKEVSFSVWLRNIFVPMFGQHDFLSRIISFAMRLIQVVFRGSFMLLYTSMSLGLIVIWLFLPIVTVLAIIKNLNGV